MINKLWRGLENKKTNNNNDNDNDDNNNSLNEQGTERVFLQKGIFKVVARQAKRGQKANEQAKIVPRRKWQWAVQKQAKRKLKQAKNKWQQAKRRLEESKGQAKLRWKPNS